ncbi:MAG: hypothetical protein R2730_14150, partial [Chitinophagales bacterium]
MKLYLLLAAWLCCTLNSHAQSLNVGNTFNSGVINQTKFGINAPYLFNHLLDDNFQVVESLRDAIYETNFDLVRFPGGALGNYYRFSNPGYGLLASEVDDVANAFQCAGNYYCLEKDEFAPRNYIYDLVDLAEDRYTRIGKKTDVVFVLSIVLHWVYNEDEIENLATLNSLEDLNAAVLAGTISEDFRTRIMENYDAYSLLYNSDYINVVGAEFGNELYFHQELTTLDKTLNGNPFFNLQTTLNQVYHRFEMLVTMIDFYRRILTPVDPELKIGLPAGNINHVGGMTNL